MVAMIQRAKSSLNTLSTLKGVVFLRQVQKFTVRLLLATKNRMREAGRGDTSYQNQMTGCASTLSSSTGTMEELQSGDRKKCS